MLDTATILADFGATRSTLTQAQIDQLDEQGYLPLPGALDAATVAALRARFDEIVASEADQEGDPASVLEFCRRTIATRSGNEDIAVGAYRSLDTPDGTWAYTRGDGATVLLNMSDDDATFEGVQGTVVLATDHDLEGSSIEGALTLPAWRGAVVTR